MDIDLLGRMSNQQDHIRAIIENVAGLSVDEDGMVYNTIGLLLQETQAGAEYQGLSARFTAHLTKARIPANRGTPIEHPVTFSADFAHNPTNKQRWRAFLRRLGREEPELDQVVRQLGDRLAPYLEGKSFTSASK